MAWTSPRTWVAGAVVTAAQLNAHLRDNLQALLPLDATAWTSYTPTLIQSGAVTKTVTYAHYTQVGKWVRFEVKLTVTGTGTATNAITVSLPVTAIASAALTFAGGVGAVSNVTSTYPGLSFIVTTTTCALIDSAIIGGAQLGATGSSTTAALANTNVVYMGGSYEAA